MRRIILAAGFALAMSSTAALAQSTPAVGAPTAAPASAAGHYNTTTTEIGVLLDDPAAKAILVKYLPEMVSNPQIDMGRGMTLRDTQQYAPDMLSDETLAKIDAELAKLPPGK